MADEAVRVSQQQIKPIKIKKWKVRQGITVSIGRIILIYEVPGAEKPEQSKLKAFQAGIIHKILAEEGDVVNPGEPLYEIKACSHPTIMNDMCAECGADLRQDDSPKSTASVPMIHAIPDLKVSEEQAQELGRADNDRLIKDRKLVLLVDLDQTLIHTTNDNIPPNIKDVYHFQLYGPKSPWYHTRLRPGTHKFLNSICSFYELHICTFGARNYAHMIAMFLDPDQTFFSNRILSRDECFDPTSKKANLRALFPCGDDMVCIIDDREDVWSHATNLIHVKPYHFFQHTGDINAPPGLDKHEDDDKEGVDLTKIVGNDKGKDKDSEESKETDISEDCKETSEDDKEMSEENVELNEGEQDEVKNNELGEGSVELKEGEQDDEVKNNELGEGSRGKEINENGLNIDKESEPVGIMEDKTKDSDKRYPNNEMEVTEFCVKVQSIAEIKQNGVECMVEETMEDSVISSTNNEKNLSVKDFSDDNDSVSSNGKKDIMDINEKADKHKEEISEEKEETHPHNKKESDEAYRSKKTEETKENPDNEKENDCVKSSDNNGKLKTVVDDPQNNNETLRPEDHLIEVEDPDDYLIYLEEVLKRIHNNFYERFDKMESGKIPDLKKIIPNVRSKILEGCKLVFSGLVPTHYKLEQSKAYLVARSLGAEVMQDLEDDSTHLVAVRPGTAKVNAGRRKKNFKIVTPDWLWCCAERWEHVDERIFPLNSKGSKNRHPPPHCSSPDHVPSYPEHDTPALRKRTPSGRFMDTINPLMSFSTDDIADMDKEVEDILDDESDDSEEEIAVAGPEDNDEENEDTDGEDIAIKQLVQSEILDNYGKQEDGDRESNNGDFEEGEIENKSPKRKREEEESNQEELPSLKFRRGEDVDLDRDDPDKDPDDQDSDSFEAPDESDDGEWNMMGAALEREFLSN